MADAMDDYYERKRLEAAEALKALEQAKANGADYETIRRLERKLELARYVGD